MNELFKGLILIALCIIKLVVTGIFLCIGFRIGGALYDAYLLRKEKRKADSSAQVVPTV